MRFSLTLRKSRAFAEIGYYSNLRALETNSEFWWLSDRKNDIGTFCRLYFHL